MKGDIYIEREREREINLLFRLFMHLLVDFFKDFIYSLLERGEREKHQCVRDISCLSQDCYPETWPAMQAYG